MIPKGHSILCKFYYTNRYCQNFVIHSHSIHRASKSAVIDLLFYLGHIACLPPSTGTHAPVMKEESSEAKKAIAFATSSGCPGRPKAWVSLDLSRNWKKKIGHV